MTTYTIIVTVEAETQSKAFAFVEAAMERAINVPVLRQNYGPFGDGDVSVKTPDGTKATVF